jgi:isocitrate dehydrogenase (NAD+)
LNHSVGRNIANPVAMLNASVNMLRHLGKTSHAQLISDAIHHTLSTAKIHTFDVGGGHSTTEVIAAIKTYIGDNLHKYKSQF